MLDDAKALFFSFRTWWNSRKRNIKEYIKSLCKQGSSLDLTNLDHSYFLRELEELGISSRIIRGGILQLRKESTVHNILSAGGCYSDLDGVATLRIAGNKLLCHELLSEAKLPVPEHVVLKSGDVQGVLQFKERIHGDIVIKPAGGTGDGHGVVIKPATRKEIWRAVNLASQYGEKIIVERFYEGTNYRLLFCKNKFLAACSRNPANIQGDGKRTIHELIIEANKSRKPVGELLEFDTETRPISYKITVNDDLLSELKKQGYTLESVPGAGKTIALQNICHWLRGGYYMDVTDEISPSIVELCRQAVSVLGVKLAGVDIIARDIYGTAGSFVINEVNTTPDLLPHYEVQNQARLRPVAREILKIIFDIRR